MVPVVTGVALVSDVFNEEGVLPSRASTHKVVLAAFTRTPERDAFEREFARFIGVPWSEYAVANELRGLYRDCGGLPRLVELLAGCVREMDLSVPRLLPG